MKNVVMSMVSGFIIAVVLVYMKSKGVRIDSKKLEKLKKEIHSKPIGVVVDSVNEWLS